MLIADALAASERDRARQVDPAVKIAAACELAELGFHMLPIVPSAKRPPFPTGPGHADAATRDPEIIAAWIEHDPRWEVAAVLHLSGHVAIDVDRKTNQQKVDAWLHRLDREAGGFIGHTASQTTPNRGWHYIFTAPEGVDLRGRLAPKIELQRHILVVAPSSGRRWIEHPRSGILPFPEALIPRATRPEIEKPQPGNMRRRSTAGLIRTIEEAREGERNNTLYWAACRLYERECLDTDGNDLIFAAACAGLPIEEAIATVESARRMAVGNYHTTVATPQRQGGI